MKSQGDFYRGTSPLRVGGVRAIIYRQIQRIASPLIQDEKGGSKQIPHLFHESLWVHNEIVGDVAVMATYSETEWARLAKRWLEDENQKTKKPSEGKKRFTNRPFAEAFTKEPK